MFENLPGLLSFRPGFYNRGPTRFHLPLLYDLVARRKPKSIVSLGLGDGQAFFTFCQAVREEKFVCSCTVVRRAHPAEKESDDRAWQNAMDYGEEFYGGVSHFLDRPRVVSEFADGSVDVLFLDNFDSGREMRADLYNWEAKLAPDGLILLHGIDLECADPPKVAWREWSGERPILEVHDGIGLGIALKTSQPREFLLQHLLALPETAGELISVYRIAAARMIAELRAEEAEAEEIERLRRECAQARADFENLHRDRAKAQVIMDAQFEQVKFWMAAAEEMELDRDKFRAEVQAQEQIASAAAEAGPTEIEKQRRPISERILRQLKRTRRNPFGRRDRATDPEETPLKLVRSPQPEEMDRYAAWIAQHEPNTSQLEEQWAASQLWKRNLKISLLVTLCDARALFLDEMFSSIRNQTYQNWELCLVCADSSEPGTLEILERWSARDPRLRIERLNGEPYLADMANAALKLGNGDFVARLNPEDLLAPFALYELATAIRKSPEAAIFYSDEDCCSENGKRRAPFFKPDWSPELLYSCMYLGDLIAYRRRFVEELGGWRTQFDRSQDYDLALRATERAREIVHIPRVLYHRREHSRPAVAPRQPDTRNPKLAALEEAMRRRNLSAEVLEYPRANRVRLKISQWPKVSIVIGSDSTEPARRCLDRLPQTTFYPDYEIVLVTKATLAGALEISDPDRRGIRYVTCEEPFNFSEMCNRGAAVADGDRLIFLGVDIEPIQPNWIENLIEPLQNPEVGAVGPKLLYATGKIRHAGLISGVRGLVSSAFHQLPADTTAHRNLAQSMRDVSALSGACLAIRREDFLRVGGFDAENTPTAHSDVDLCFKLREAGLRCVYTPFATLLQDGADAIGGEEIRSAAAHPRDKSFSYLLKRWGGSVARDPFFTSNMRDWSHADSTATFRMFGKDNREPLRDSRDLLFVSDELSLSHAPMLLLRLAIWCRNNGIFVVVLAAEDGPLRQNYETAGIPLIIDPLILTGLESSLKFARDFDCVLANTIRSEPAVRSAKSAGAAVIWWMHDDANAEQQLREGEKLRSALALADVILTTSERAANIYQACAASAVKRLIYEIPDVAEQKNEVRSLGENARATFPNNFALDRFGADFRELVEEVIALSRA
ncbi:MAG TPA: glycosyltransferase [Chthoniobacterales bacterium]|jgi:GT2 family glycosyltransferase